MQVSSLAVGTLIGSECKFSDDDSDGDDEDLNIRGQLEARISTAAQKPKPPPKNPKNTKKNTKTN